MDRKIKVAFFTYPSAFQNPGGGEVLLLKTKEYLEKEGVYCKLFDMWNDKLDDFDILHVFGAVKASLGLMQTASNKKIKVVIDPIFFSTIQRGLHESGGLMKKAEGVARHIVKVLFPRFPSSRRMMMTIADAVVPNSFVELKQIGRLFAIDAGKMHVIPNGVDPAFGQGDRRLFVSKYGLEDFVLSVGRIEPRKNQLNLIKAMNGSTRPLVIIGDPVSDYTAYYEQCRHAAASNVKFVGRIGHDDPLLKSAYKACACYVSQGWFETPGLAALEAGLAGAPVATTDKGCTREFFINFVEYFDPSDIRSMRNAIERALRRNDSAAFSEYIKKDLLWGVSAKKRVALYENLLCGKCSA
jgi:glycosyltransferase involved in cell wall biosynthesis